MPKATKKRLYSLAATLIAFVILFPLSSCSPSDRMQEDDQTTFSLSSLSAVVPDGNQSVPVVGTETEFKVLHEKGTGGGFFFSSGDKKDIVSLAAYERNYSLEKKYLLTISSVSSADIKARVRADVLSGLCEYDAILLDVKSAAVLASEGALKDLCTIEGFSEKSSFSQKASKALSVAGKQYTLLGSALPDFLYATSALIMNSSATEKSNTSAIISSSLAGVLTWDDVTKITLSASDLNKDDEKPLFAPSNTSLSVFLSGGVPFFTKDDVTEKLMISSFEEKSAEIFNSTLNIFGSDRCETDKSLKLQTAVSEKLFSVATVGDYKNLKSSTDFLFLLPMPKMFAEQENYSSKIDMSNLLCFAIPQNAESPASSVENLDLIFSLSGSILSAAKEEMKSPSPSEHVYNAGTRLIDIIADSGEYGIVSMFGWVDFSEFLESSIMGRLDSDSFVSDSLERARVALLACEIFIEKNSKKPENPDFPAETYNGSESYAEN